MNNNLKGLNLNSPGPEMRAALDMLHENLEIMMEYEHLQAKLTRAKYDAMIEQGFTAEQALELCKKTVTQV